MTVIPVATTVFRVRVGGTLLLAAATVWCLLSIIKDTKPANSILREEPAEHLEHDCGVVKPGETVECDFIIKNPSAKLWKIRAVEPTCSCIVPAISTNEISVGGHVAIKILYTPPSVYKDDVKEIGVHMNDGERDREATMKLKAYVRPELSITPRIESLGCLPVNT